MQENQKPLFWDMFGITNAIIEMTRSLLKLKDANSTEFKKRVKNNVISLVTEWKNEDGTIEKRSHKSDKEEL